MTVEEKIIEVLNKVRPFLINDGGDAEFVKYENKIAYIKMLGTCSDCDFSDLTITDTIKTILTNEIEEIEDVKEYKEDIN